MSSSHSRIQAALTAIPREAFITSSEASGPVSGHGLPSRAVLKRILDAIPHIEPDQVVLYVGAGSGYVPAVLSQLVRKVYVAEKETVLANVAATNLAAFAIENVEIIIGDAESGIRLDTPCDLILSATFLKEPANLVMSLTEGGMLINLEPEKGRPPAIVQYQRLTGVLKGWAPWLG